MPLQKESVKNIRLAEIWTLTSVLSQLGAGLNWFIIDITVNCLLVMDTSNWHFKLVSANLQFFTLALWNGHLMPVITEFCL